MTEMANSSVIISLHLETRPTYTRLARQLVGPSVPIRPHMI